MANAQATPPARIRNRERPTYSWHKASARNLICDAKALMGALFRMTLNTSRLPSKMLEKRRKDEKASDN